MIQTASEQVPEFDTFISVVIPVRNIAPRIELIVHEVSSVVRSMFRSYEIVFIDDASQDSTVAIIMNLQRSVESLQLFCLNRSVGFDVATIAGLDNCIGDFVFILNVDTDPVDILPQLWRKTQEGNEVVTGVRYDRIRGSLRAWLSRVYYNLFHSVTGIRVPLGISSPRLYSRKVVGYITQNNDRNIMLKVLPFFSSYRIGTVEYTATSAGNSFGERHTGRSYHSYLQFQPTSPPLHNHGPALQRVEPRIHHLRPRSIHIQPSCC